MNDVRFHTEIVSLIHQHDVMLTSFKFEFPGFFAALEGQHLELFLVRPFPFSSHHHGIVALSGCGVSVPDARSVL